LAPDAFGSDLSKLAERFAIALRRHVSEAAQGGNKLPKLSWTATERTHFNQLVSERKPTTGAEWQSIADSLGTGRSGEALRKQLHTKRHRVVQHAPDEGQAHASSRTLCIAASSPASAPQSEPPAQAPLCIPLRLGLPAQSDAANGAIELAAHSTAFPTPRPMDLEVQSVASVGDEDSAECVLTQGVASHAGVAMAEQGVDAPLLVTRGVQTDPDALSELAMESDHRMGELIALRKQYADLAAKHAELREQASSAGVAGRRARPTFLGEPSGKQVRVGSRHQVTLPPADEDSADATDPIPTADSAFELQLTHNAALLARARAKCRRAWSDAGALRVDIGSIHAARLCDRLHDSAQRDEKGRLVVGGVWDEKDRRYVGGRAFSGYSEYRGTHAREQGMAHDRKEQQRNTVVFSADDFGFAREHVRSHSKASGAAYPPRLVTSFFARACDLLIFCFARCADPGAQSACPRCVQQAALLFRRGRLPRRSDSRTRALPGVRLHKVRHTQGAPSRVQ